MSRWYGHQAAWTLAFERAAILEHGEDLSVELEMDRLTYRHRGLEVPGRLEPVPVTIRFFEQPRYDAFGLRPAEFPRVFADPGARSPHRHAQDDALCLYYPDINPGRRWTPDEGLLALLNLTRDHLFFELHWRATRDRRGRRGVWLAPEVTHERKAAA